jgi:nitroreductase
VDALDAIFGRRSISRLRPPAPTEDDLDTILRAGAAAPDHLSLRPWKFVVLEGDAKDEFGGVLADAYRARSAAAGKEVVPAKLEKERTKLGRAPLVVVVCTVNRGEDLVPFVEQLAAGAAAAQNMLIAATALGYGSMWRTGDPAYDERVLAALGLSAANDAIVGFLYVGTTPDEGSKPRNDPSVEELAARWSPP